MRSSMILTWEDTYCPSSAELYGFDLRRPVLSIIWGSLWFWPEKARTVHHLGSSIILTWEDTYCPSSGELYEFNRRGHVLSIICGRDAVYMILTWEDTYCPSSGELYDFDSRGHVLSIIWVAMRFWPEKVLSITGSSIGLSIIWGALWLWRRGHVLFIILGALWFWHEKARTVHHLGSYMILT